MVQRRIKIKINYTIIPLKKVVDTNYLRSVKYMIEMENLKIDGYGSVKIYENDDKSIIIDYYSKSDSFRMVSSILNCTTILDDENFLTCSYVIQKYTEKNKEILLEVCRKLPEYRRYILKNIIKESDVTLMSTIFTIRSIIMDNNLSHLGVVCKYTFKSIGDGDETLKTIIKENKYPNVLELKNGSREAHLYMKKDGDIACKLVHINTEYILDENDDVYGFLLEKIGNPKVHILLSELIPKRLCKNLLNLTMQKEMLLNSRIIKAFKKVYKTSDFILGFFEMDKGDIISLKGKRGRIEIAYGDDNRIHTRHFNQEGDLVRKLTYSDYVSFVKDTKGFLFGDSTDAILNKNEDFKILDEVFHSMRPMTLESIVKRFQKSYNNAIKNGNKADVLRLGCDIEELLNEKSFKLMRYLRYIDRRRNKELCDVLEKELFSSDYYMILQSGLTGSLEAPVMEVYVSGSTSVSHFDLTVDEDFVVYPLDFKGAFPVISDPVLLEIIRDYTFAQKIRSILNTLSREEGIEVQVLLRDIVAYSDYHGVDFYDNGEKIDEKFLKLIDIISKPAIVEAIDTLIEKYNK